MPSATRNGAGLERVQLRERLGPTPAESRREEQASASGDGASTHEDPAGPHAKTADLKHPAQTPPAQSAGDSAALAGSNGASVVVAAARRRHRAAAEENAARCSASANNEVAPAPPPPLAPRARPNRCPSTKRLRTANPRPRRNPSARLPRKPSRARARRPRVQRAKTRQHGDSEDLGDVFGRVLALSLTLNHPAFQRATEGFADDGRVYLVYPDEQFVPLSQRRGGLKMSEAEAIAVAIQVCQAVSFRQSARRCGSTTSVPNRSRMAPDGRVKLIGLDYVSNDNELQSEPIFNDGYTAPEIYRGKRGRQARRHVFGRRAALHAA